MRQYPKRVVETTTDPETYSNFTAALIAVLIIVLAVGLATLAVFGVIMAMAVAFKVHALLAVGIGLGALLVAFILIVSAIGEGETVRKVQARLDGEDGQ